MGKIAEHITVLKIYNLNLVPQEKKKVDTVWCLRLHRHKKREWFPRVAMIDTQYIDGYLTLTHVKIYISFMFKSTLTNTSIKQLV